MYFNRRAFLHTCKHTHTHTHTEARTRARTHTHTHTHRGARGTHTHTHTHTHTLHTHTHTLTLTLTRTLRSVHTRTRTNTHTHTHTHSARLFVWCSIYFTCKLLFEKARSKPTTAVSTCFVCRCVCFFSAANRNRFNWCCVLAYGQP